MFLGVESLATPCLRLFGSYGRPGSRSVSVCESLSSHPNVSL
jgi:hypothetical protein